MKKTKETLETEAKVELMAESIVSAIVDNKDISTKAFKAYLKEEGLTEDYETIWDYIENEYYNDIDDTILESNTIGRPRWYFGFSGVLNNFGQALDLVDKDERLYIHDAIESYKDKVKDKIKKYVLDYVSECTIVE